MKTRSALLVASVLAVVVGCGGHNSDEDSQGSDVVPCVGDACWDCKPIQIKSADSTGSQTVCEKTAQSNDGVPPSYDCVAGSGPECPPLIPIGNSYSSDGTYGGDASTTIISNDGVGADAGSSTGSQDGVSDAGCEDAGSGTSTSADSGSHVGSDAGSGGGSDAGTTTVDAGGGDYHCEVDAGKITCTSSCGCDAGTDAGGGTDSGIKVDAGTTHDSGSLGCTLTQGYWKTHAKAWPVQSLVLGGKSYTEAELLAILNTPANGDASIILAYQLIAAKLNVLKGASSSPISTVIAQADAWLAAHADADGRLPFGVSSSSAAGQVAVSLGAELDAYNNGQSGVPHCN